MKKKPLCCDDVISELNYSSCEPCKKKDEALKSLREVCGDWSYLEYRKMRRAIPETYPCARDQAFLHSLHRRKKRKDIYEILDTLLHVVTHRWFLIYAAVFLALYLAALLDAFG